MLRDESLNPSSMRVLKILARARLSSVISRPTLRAIATPFSPTF
jgi:hypothetical protein